MKILGYTCFSLFIVLISYSFLSCTSPNDVAAEKDSIQLFWSEFRSITVYFNGENVYQLDSGIKDPKRNEWSLPIYHASNLHQDPRPKFDGNTFSYYKQSKYDFNPTKQYYQLVNSIYGKLSPDLLAIDSLYILGYYGVKDVPEDYMYPFKGHDNSTTIILRDLPIQWINSDTMLVYLSGDTILNHVVSLRDWEGDFAYPTYSRGYSYLSTNWASLNYPPVLRIVLTTRSGF